MKRITLVATGAFIAVLVWLVGSVPASADRLPLLPANAVGNGHAGVAATHVPSAAAAATSKELRQEVADVLRRTPGSRQTGPTTIKIGSDITMELATPRTKTVAADLTAYCPSFYVCVFNNKNFNVGSTNGHQLNYTKCGQEVNLGRIAFPGGGWWNDKVSSIINNQSTGTNSFFYDYSGGTNGTWIPIKTVAAPSHASDLSLETDGSGRTLNDRIDGVHVCGSPPYPWHPNYP